MRRDDRGSAAVELAVLAPAFVALVLLVVVAGRVSTVRGEVARVAGDAARAASLRQTAHAATVDAATAVDDARVGGTSSCASVATAVDTDRFGPGGSVSVTVSCEVDLADVALLAVPGRVRVTATAVEVIDLYRGDR